jgi:hypothetical protein
MLLSASLHGRVEKRRQVANLAMASAQTEME